MIHRADSGSASPGRLRRYTPIVNARRRQRVIGETVLWTVTVGLVGWVAFRWTGIAAAIALCAVSPKELDRKVGPAHYRDLPLRELCTRLSRDHGIRCDVEHDASQARMDFDIPHPMSRRDVLRKLADESGLHLWLRGCGMDATVLWGSYDSAHLVDPDEP